jgi:thiamine-phosphate pyrophosphorylase
MISKPPRIYAIADADALGPARLAPAVREMAGAGVRWIQVRAKSLDDAELWRRAEECCEALAGSSAELWMDDRADLAALLPFRGVHLGQDDLPPSAARRAVGSDCWIGRSTHDPRQVRAADLDPEVDLIAYGPIFTTRSKANPDPEVGLAGLSQARAMTDKPLVAIGGIDAANADRALAAGADSVAMIGAVCNGNIAANCTRLLRAAARRANG